MPNSTLLSFARNAARAGKALLGRLVRPKSAGAIRFPSDADVIGALSDQVPVVEQVKRAVRGGQVGRARSLLTDHFRARTTPRFFVHPTDIRPLAAALEATHPDWASEARRASFEWQRFVYFAPGAWSVDSTVPDWNHLPFGPGGDGRYASRAHEFSFSVHLARALAYRTDTKATLRRLIESWVISTEVAANPTGYSDPLIAAHRAVALTWAWAFLAGCEERDPDLEFLLVKIILADARFIHARLGTSFPNNHLLGDAFSMWYLGTLFPEFREADDWRRDGERVFLRELKRQIYEDGTSFEHSVHYHELACEMVTGFVLLARRNGVQVEPWVAQRHRRMLEFQAALGGVEARTVQIGDSAEAHLFPLDGFDGVGAAAHREILRALYDSSVPGSTPDAKGQERAAWMLGGHLAPPEPVGADELSRGFSDGGYFIFNDPANDGSVVFRTGPAPDRVSNSGHMHADLLSVFVRLKGVPVVVDGGTYTYRSRGERWPAGTPQWRAHFLGPAAHNGLCIVGYDPLDRGPGDFPSGALKSRVPTTRLALGRSLEWVEGTIIGNTVYSGHTRGVIRIPGRYWVTYDLLPDSAGREPGWLSLHLSPRATVTQLGPSALAIEGDGARLVVATTHPLALLEAAQDRPEGWVSSRYGDLTSAVVCRVPTAGCSGAVAGVLEPGPEISIVPTVDVAQNGSAALAVRIRRDHEIDYLLLRRDVEAPRAALFGIDFDGDALWLRTKRSRLAELRALSTARANSSALGFAVTSQSGPRDLEVVFEAQEVSQRSRAEAGFVIELA